MTDGANSRESRSRKTEKEQLMKSKCFALAILALLASGNASAFDVGLGIKGGLLGYGPEATLGLSEHFNVRLGQNTYSYKTEVEESDISYDGELDWKSTALLLDWHPFGGTFRLTAGLVNNRNAIRLTATPTSNQEIGGTTYTPAQIGTLSGNVTFDKNVPFFGLGWGNAVGKGFPLGVNFEIGVLKQGSPKVNLSSSNTAVSQSDLEAEARQTEEDLKDYDIYPVIALGLSYRF
jgi:hypothetical protein